MWQASKRAKDEVKREGDWEERKTLLPLFSLPLCRLKELLLLFSLLPLFSPLPFLPLVMQAVTGDTLRVRQPKRRLKELALAMGDR